MKRSALPLVRGVWERVNPLTETTGATDGRHEVGAVRVAIVREEALDPHPAAGKPGEGPAQKPDHGDAAFVGQDLDVRNPRAVIDNTRGQTPTNAAGADSVVTGDPVPDLADPAELLRIEMHQLPRRGPFVAAPVTARAPAAGSARAAPTSGPWWRGSLPPPRRSARPSN